MSCLPICLLAGRNLATATFVNGLIVALTVAISDAVRRGVAEELVEDLGGLEFRHPIDIDGIWAQVPCTQCHSPYSGY